MFNMVRCFHHYGDIYIKKIGEKHYYLRSINGFNLAASASTKKIWEFELFNKSFELKGEIDIWLREMQPGNHRLEIDTATGLDASLGLSVDGYVVTLDTNVTKSGWANFEWNLSGDCDGFIMFDSSYLSGSIDVEAMYNGYGIRSVSTNHLDGNGYLVQCQIMESRIRLNKPIRCISQEKRSYEDGYDCRRCFFQKQSKATFPENLGINNV